MEGCFCAKLLISVSDTSESRAISHGLSLGSALLVRCSPLTLGHIFLRRHRPLTVFRRLTVLPFFSMLVTIGLLSPAIAPKVES